MKKKVIAWIAVAALSVSALTGCGSKGTDEHYGDPALCLSRISDLFHISESYFSFLFKKTVGVNFSTYLEQVRMTQAKHLLETTNIKITDLYVAVGYNNLTSFRRAFKKKDGVAPNAIRE